MGAIGHIVDPVIEGAGGHNSVGATVCVLVHACQRHLRVVLSGNARSSINVYAQSVFIDVVDPRCNLVGGEVEVDVSAFGSIAHIHVFAYLGIELTHCLHFASEHEGRGDAAVPVKTDGHSRKNPVKACRLCCVRIGIVCSLVSEQVFVELAEGVAEPSHAEKEKCHHDDAEVGESEGDPPQMHTGFAGENLVEMRGDHADESKHAADHDKSQDRLNEVEGPSFKGIEEIRSHVVERGGGGVDVIGVHGQALHVDLSICLDIVGRVGESLRCLEDPISLVRHHCSRIQNRIVDVICHRIVGGVWPEATADEKRHHCGKWTLD